MQTVHTDEDAEGYLGPVGLLCKPKGWDGGNVLLLVIALPFLALFALLGSAPLTEALGFEPPIQTQPVFYVLFAVIFSGLVYLVVKLENVVQREVLATHAHGIRYGSTAVLYDDITTIREGTAVSKAMPTFQWLFESTNAHARLAKNAAYTIETTTGKQITLKMAATRFDADDLQQVLTRVQDEVARRGAKAEANSHV